MIACIKFAMSTSRLNFLIDNTHIKPLMNKMRVTNKIITNMKCKNSNVISCSKKESRKGISNTFECALERMIVLRKKVCSLLVMVTVTIVHTQLKVEQEYNVYFA